MLAPAAAGLSVAEYAAKVVKKALVGTGGADKHQIAFMVARLLPTSGAPVDDAGGAPAAHPPPARRRPARRAGGPQLPGPRPPGPQSRSRRGIGRLRGAVAEI